MEFPPGIIWRRTLPDGRVIDIIPLTFGRARLGIGWPDDVGYQDVW